MNKKVMLFLTIMVSVLLLTILTGCAKKDDIKTVKNVSDNQQEVSIGNNQFDNSKIKKFYYDKLNSGDYYIKMKASFEGEIATIETSKEGDTVASHIKEQNLTTLFKDDKTYTIDHNNKLIYEISNSIESNNMLQLEDNLSQNSENIEILSGTEDIDGVTYDYEELDATRFYFINNIIKYIKVDNELIEILEISNTSKDSLFEIPNDYTTMTI